ncbi:MAG: hypothetical protein IPN22_10080 [Bacteroidetes bacterium]|nr:hypothetical protein [Bacteroidota bacterium]
MYIARLLFFVAVWLGLSAQAQPLSTHPISTQSEVGFEPCRDTFHLFKRQEFYDIGVILPSWLPIVDKHYVAIVEGKVTYNRSTGAHGPYMCNEDLPFYHYSHDFDFDIVPDATPDNRYTNLLPLLVYNTSKGPDTILAQEVHCEWESGIGMNNPINPLRTENEAGNSAGFFTAGHERGDVLWNFPTIGDWVHVEGHYVWDRGHPPAEAEIHPPRFLAVKRHLPEQIMIGDSSLKFATRIDLFASGDGGALINNRYNAPKFVQKVNMSGKDYEFTTRINLPRPSPQAQLRYSLEKRKGDDFSAPETIVLNSDSGTVTVLLPWKSKNANDLEVYARTLFVFWDEGRGVHYDLPIDAYRVRLSHVYFRKLNDYLSKAEVRLFANVGNHWIFVNDFFGKNEKILSAGMGKTRKKHWDLRNEFMVYLPRGEHFRVFMSGWEVDGVDLLSGKLLDPNSACDKKTKRFFKNNIFSISKMLMKGCMDDEYGNISMLHSAENLGKENRYVNSPKEGKNDDPCPFSKYPLKDRYFLTYSIEKVN